MDFKLYEKVITPSEKQGTIIDIFQGQFEDTYLVNVDGCYYKIGEETLKRFNTKQIGANRR